MKQQIIFYSNGSISVGDWRIRSYLGKGHAGRQRFVANGVASLADLDGVYLSQKNNDTWLKQQIAVRLERPDQ